MEGNTVFRIESPNAPSSDLTLEGIEQELLLPFENSLLHEVHDASVNESADPVKLAILTN